MPPNSITNGAMQTPLVRTKGAPNTKKGLKFKNSGLKFTPKNPNAMDVNQLTTEQWANHMKKGLCFKCHRFGHRANECGQNASTSKPTSTLVYFLPKYKKANNTYIYQNKGDISQTTWRRTEEVDRQAWRLRFLKWQPVSATAPAPIFLQPVLLANLLNMKFFSILLKVTGEGKNAEKQFKINALIDSGAQGKFLNKEFALRNRIVLNKLNNPITVYNVDGTKNNSGKIEYSTWLKMKIDNKEMNTRFLVTDIGKETIILRLPWLKQYNPIIDWDKGTMDISNVKLSKTFGEVFQWSVELF